MRIDNFQIRNNAIQPQQPAAAPQPGAKSFSETLTQAIEQVNETQNKADTLATRVATGDMDKLHEAMIAMEKASLALELSVQVRNKVIEAYQELMRTQV